ncbi:MAG: polymerase sigma-70 factor, subfamily [Actinomycetota bacterium]|nr:polymerase sigma-70 factor, subfamily [Actinomycetota bacterium]
MRRPVGRREDFVNRFGGGTRTARAVYAMHTMDRRSDAELVIAARQGDLGAFAVLVERYRAPALRVAYGIAGNEAEDAVQDAFVKAYRKLEGFRTDAAFRPWLFTIVANEARNRRRSSSRRSKLDLQVRDQPRSAAAAVEDVVARRDQRRRLLDVVASLPDRYREVVALRYFAGLSESETAEVLSCPLGTAKSRLSRALNLLRAQLGEEVVS